MKSKKILAGLLAITLTAGSAAVVPNLFSSADTESSAVMTASVAAQDMFEISVNDEKAKTATIDKYKGTETDVDIPSKVTKDGVEYTVTELGGSSFQGNTKLVSVVIPDTVTSINGGILSDSAFMGCKSLKYIKFPESLVTIGKMAFCNCTSLTSVVLPENLTNISDYAFEGCTSLDTFIIPQSCSTIGFEAFRGCVSLKKVVIPKTSTSIGDCSFGYDSHSKKITDFTIYGEKGSQAEQYANKEGFTFIESDTTHEWTEWETVKEPTSEKHGLRKRTCTAHGEEHIEAIAKSNSTPSEVDPAPSQTDPDPSVVDPNPSNPDPNPPIVDPDPTPIDPEPPIVDPDPTPIDPKPSTVDPIPTPPPSKPDSTPSNTNTTPSSTVATVTTANNSNNTNTNTQNNTTNNANSTSAASNPKTGKALASTGLGMALLGLAGAVVSKVKSKKDD